MARNECNGECYQGRWCNCKDENYDDEMYRKDLIFSAFVSTAIAAVIFIAGYLVFKVA